MRDDGDLDRLVDRALGTYGAAGPGLEQRVLAHIARGRKPAPPLGGGGGRMAWAGALATATCLLLLLLVLLRARPADRPAERARHTPAFEPPPTETARKAVERAQPTSGVGRPGRPQNAARKPLPAALPKQDMFPMPRPLSPAERALVEFAAQAPEAERESLVEARDDFDGPIHAADIRIDAIRIPPLESSLPGTH